MQDHICKKEQAKIVLLETETASLAFPVLPAISEPEGQSEPDPTSLEPESLPDPAPDPTA